jgi:hypothetical protein
MQAVLHATPRFVVTLSLLEYYVLKRCSQCHYDGVCKSASLLGGFLYSWDFCIPESADRNNCTATFDVMCSFREIDTCLKILEMPPFDVAIDARSLSAQLRRCLTFSDTTLFPLSFQIPL